MITDRFKSRYGQLRTITEQGDGSFIVEGESLYHRCGATEDGADLWMVDFEGGPFICVGDPLLGHKNYGVIKKIQILEDDRNDYFKVKVFCE